MPDSSGGSRIADALRAARAGPGSADRAAADSARGGFPGAARRARENAVAPFSNFKVGAALETADGTIVTGCNVENATYGLTMCAERVAMFKALSEGHRAFTRLALVVDMPAPTPPCGACRQILWEFGGNLEIRLANLTEDKGTHRLEDLLRRRSTRAYSDIVRAAEEYGCVVGAEAPAPQARGAILCWPESLCCRRLPARTIRL